MHSDNIGKGAELNIGQAFGFDPKPLRDRLIHSSFGKPYRRGMAS
jgi:hypothetical protein